jgi:hypothetical protein
MSAVLAGKARGICDALHRPWSVETAVFAVSGAMLVLSGAFTSQSVAQLVSRIESPSQTYRVLQRVEIADAALSDAAFSGPARMQPPEEVSSTEPVEAHSQRSVAIQDVKDLTAVGPDQQAPT